MDHRFDNWRKSSRSGEGNGGCVEVASTTSTVIGVRDSKEFGRGPVLTVDANRWVAFLSAVRSGRLSS